MALPQTMQEKRGMKRKEGKSLPIAVQKTAHSEVEPLLQTEERPRGHGAVAKLTGEAAVEQRAVNAPPYSLQLAQTVAALTSRQLVSVEMMEHAGVYEHEPAQVLVAA